MIITHITAGMGNQMFMYAAGLAVSQRLHTELRLNNWEVRFNKSRPYTLSCFPNITERQASFWEIWRLCPSMAVADLISYKPIKKSDILRRIIRKIIIKFFPTHEIKSKTVYAPVDSNIYSPAFNNITDNTYIRGFWESEKFFADIKDLIREKFQFSAECFNPELLQKVQSCNSVALHVRRGDKTSWNNFTERTYYYLQNALPKIFTLVENPHFFVFSDDIDWCKENLPQIHEANYTFIEGQTPPQDMALMTICKNVIIAPSTFSWWGAWLNKNPDKIIIAPDINLWGTNYENRRDYLLEEWIKIS